LPVKRSTDPELLIGIEDFGVEIIKGFIPASPLEGVDLFASVNPGISFQLVFVTEISALRYGNTSM